MRNISRVFLFSVAYFLGAEVGHSLQLFQDFPPTFWPPSGIFLAALLLTEIGLWPFLSLGAFVANSGFAWIHENPLASGAIFSLIHISGLLLGAGLYKRWITPFPRLYTLKEVLGLIGLTIAFSSIISTIPFMVNLLQGTEFPWIYWKLSCTAEAMGVFLYASLILTWSTWRPDQFRSISFRRMCEGGLLFGLLTAFFLIGIYLYPELVNRHKFLSLPLLIWGALRFGPRGATFLSFLFCHTVLWVLCQRKDLLEVDSKAVADFTFMLQGFMCTASAVALVPAATLAESECLVSRLNRISRLNTVIGQINQMAVKTQDAYTLLQEACRIMVELGKFRMAWVGNVDTDTGDIYPIVHAGLEDGYLSIHQWRTDESPCGLGLVGVAYRSGTYAVIEDSATDPSVKPWREEALKRGYRSGSAFAITLNDLSDGVLVIYSEESGFFDDQVVSILGEVASDITQALDGIRKTERRKEAEEALRRTNEQLTSIIQASPAAILVLDRDGVVLDWNPAASRIFGYTEVEVMGQFLPTALGVKEREVRRNIAAVLSGETISFLEVQRQHKDGHLVDVSLSTAPIRDRSGTIIGLVAVYIDLTEKKQMDKALRESEEQFRILTRHIPVGISFMAPDHRMTFANPAFTEITGYTLEDMPTKEAYFDLAYPDTEYRKQMLSKWGLDMPKDSPFGTVSNRIFRIRCKDGTDKDCIVRTIILADGSHLYTYYDITEQRQAEIALEESERRLRELLETVELYAILLDSNGTITFVNDCLLKQTGWNRSEVLENNWFTRFLPTADAETAKKTYLSDLSTETLTAHCEFPILTRDGGERLVTWNNTLLKDPSGQVIGMACLGIDVTEHRRLEEQYRQSQKMEAIGQLAGGVAHDFNNLLQAIQGYTDLALVDLPAESEPHQNLSESQKAIDRAAGLVRQLLAFSRRQTLQFRVIDLDEIISNLTNMLRRVIGEHIELEILPGCLGEKVHADPGQMEQILLNLCLNARDAMPDGGKIQIETSSVSFDHGYVDINSWAREGDYIQIIVADTGCGMPPEVLDKIFDPFFTTKEVGHGTGLGLATVYGIIRQHEGMIHVYSEVNHGTTFRVYLPVSTVETPQPEPVSPDQPRPRGGNETILVAEDEDLLRNLALRILRNAGYTVLTAADGEEALKLYHANRDQIDLLLLDMVMPKLSGRQVYEAVIEENPDTRFIFSTGYSFSTLDRGQLPKEGIPFIQKPYSPSVLLKTVRDALGG